MNFVDPTGFFGMGINGDLGVEIGFGDNLQWGMTYQVGVAGFQNGGSTIFPDRIAYQTVGSNMDYADVHTKEKGEWIAGAYAGFGVGFTLTSADSAEKFKDIPQVFNLNTPIGALSIGYGNGDFSLSLSVGPGLIGSISNYDTETVYLSW